MAGSASLTAIRLPLTMPPLENDYRWSILHPCKLLSYRRYWHRGLSRLDSLPPHADPLMGKLPESLPRLFDNYQKPMFFVQGVAFRTLSVIREGFASSVDLNQHDLTSLGK